MALTQKQMLMLAEAEVVALPVEPIAPIEKSMIEKGVDAITPLPIGKLIDAYATPEMKAWKAEMFNNLPSSTGNLVKGVWDMATHPIEAAKGMQSLGQGILEKAVVPNEINGIDFGETENTEMVNQVGRNLKDRYWGLDNIKNTAKTDPAGMLLDMSVIPTGGQAAVGGIMKAASKLIPESKPVSMMEKALVMRPTINKHNKHNKREIAETIVKEKIDPTSTKGADKAYGNINELNGKIETLLEDVPKAQIIKKAEVLKNVESIKERFNGVQFKGKKNKQIIDKLMSDFDEHLAAIGKKDDFTVMEVQALKKELYNELENAFKKADFSGAETELMRSIASGAKESIERIAPGIKETNARLSKHYQMMEELPNSINKMENYRGVGQDLANKTVAGGVFSTSIGAPFGYIPAAIGGAIGTTGGAISGILSHPRIRAKNALLLDRLRTSGSYTDQLINEMKLPLATQGLLYSGQVNQP